MDSTHSLAHHERLRSRGSIRRLFESGRGGFIYPFRYMWCSDAAPVESSDAPDVSATQLTTVTCEVLFTVPKRFHKRANKRNLLRRRTKESYRLQKSVLLGEGVAPQNIDLAIIYSTKELHSYKTINNAVRKILENILKDL